MTSSSWMSNSCLRTKGEISGRGISLGQVAREIAGRFLPFVDAVGVILNMVDGDSVRWRLMRKQHCVPRDSSIPGMNSRNSDRHRRDKLLTAAIPEELVGTLR